MGVRATYFILVTSNNYNILSDHWCNVPRQLIALGHEVGLHYDVKFYQSPDAGPMSLLQSHVMLLGQLAGEPVRSISVHNPSISGQDIFREAAGFINAYQARFTSEISYFSDSCGAWRTQAVQSLQPGKLPPRMQLLTHPIFWAPQHADRWDRISQFVNQQINLLRRQHEMICNIWHAHSGVREHDQRQQQSAQNKDKGKGGSGT